MLKQIKLALMTIWRIVKETFVFLRKAHDLKRINRYYKKYESLSEQARIWRLMAFDEYERYITKYGMEVTENVQDNNA